MSGESSASRGSRKVRANPVLWRTRTPMGTCHAHAFISTDGAAPRAEQDFAGDLARTMLEFSSDKKQLNVTNCDPRVHEFRPV